LFSKKSSQKWVIKSVLVSGPPPHFRTSRSALTSLFGTMSLKLFIKLVQGRRRKVTSTLPWSCFGWRVVRKKWYIGFFGSLLVAFGRSLTKILRAR